MPNNDWGDDYRPYHTHKLSLEQALKIAEEIKRRNMENMIVEADYEDAKKHLKEMLKELEDADSSGKTDEPTEIIPERVRRIRGGWLER